MCYKTIQKKNIKSDIDDGNKLFILVIIVQFNSKVSYIKLYILFFFYFL